METTRNEIHLSGLASTRQRAWILKSLRERTDHPDAEAVHESVKVRMPSISLDTVYRTLNLFSRRGLIAQLAVPTHRFRFDGCVEAHDHFLCTRCERIADVACETSKTESIPEAVRQFGTVKAMQRIYLGTCLSCDEAVASASP